MPQKLNSIWVGFLIFVANSNPFRMGFDKMKNSAYFTVKLICNCAAVFLFLLFSSCTSTETKLPYLGNPVVKESETILPKIAEFKFTNQDHATITNKTFENKIYVADFIFLSCPTICPKMTSEMKSVYEMYKGNSKVAFLSHTIDPENDTIEKLKLYAQSMNLNSNWHFVTGNKKDILEIAEKSYFTTAYSDANEPGGFVHGGGFVLVDDKGHIRGVYDGTNSTETKRLIADIKILLKELKA
jgi:protein SCO1/2